MTPQLATNTSASAIVGGMNMVIIMSGASRLERMTSAQATAASTNSTIEVMRTAGSRTATPAGAGLGRSEAIMDAVYGWRRCKATLGRVGAAAAYGEIMAARQRVG
jgi:hypothetical protein